jgi:hypothetical protein
MALQTEQEFELWEKIGLSFFGLCVMAGIGFLIYITINAIINENKEPEKEQSIQSTQESSEAPKKETSETIENLTIDQLLLDYSTRNKYTSEEIIQKIYNQFPTKYKPSLESCKNSLDSLYQAIHCLIDDNDYNENLSKILILLTYLESIDIFTYNTSNNTIQLTPDLQQTYNDNFEEKYQDSITVSQFIDFMKKLRTQQNIECSFCGINKEEIESK